MSVSFPLCDWVTKPGNLEKELEIAKSIEFSGQSRAECVRIGIFLGAVLSGQWNYFHAAAILFLTNAALRHYKYEDLLCYRISETPGG